MSRVFQPIHRHTPYKSPSCYTCSTECLCSREIIAVITRILRYSRVRAPRNFSVPRPVFNGCTAKVAGKRRWFALREKRRRLAPSQKGSSMIVLWHSIAFENIMMVDEVPFSRYYAIKLFCVKWSLFPRRVTYITHTTQVIQNTT